MVMAFWTEMPNFVSIDILVGFPRIQLSNWMILIYMRFMQKYSIAWQTEWVFGVYWWQFPNQICWQILWTWWRSCDLCGMLSLGKNAFNHAINVGNKLPVDIGAIVKQWMMLAPQPSISVSVFVKYAEIHFNMKDSDIDCDMLPLLTDSVPPQASKQINSFIFHSECLMFMRKWRKECAK